MNETRQSPVIGVLRQVLRPLIRLLIQHQVTFPFFSDLIKRLYVDVAHNDIPLTSERLTDSRISLITGVHRKDVRRFREQPETLHSDQRKSISLSAQVLSTWLSDPEYCDRKGNPRPLWRLSIDGEPSFESLVEHVSRQDLRARSLLDEWLRLGVVSLDEKERVLLHEEAIGPPEGFEEKLFFFEKSAHDHLAAGVENLIGETSPHFDRCVYYNNLAPESVDKLQKYADQEAMKLIRQINRKAGELQKKDSGKPGSSFRFTFGAFFYHRSTAKENSEDE
ncbi:MAG: DUF6502 family protein [Gammaproteobacteria bacterium]|nr:DUF6502 family protein [Gammaproteobacteria bacterium]